MALGFDRETLLYVVGIFLGVAAAVYFGFQFFDQVSPVTTAALLFAGFVCFLVAGVGFDVEYLDVVAYALAAACYLVFVAFVISRFDVGDGGTFLLLAVSSALFIGLGYLAQERQLSITRRQAKGVIVAVLLASVVLVGVDLVGAQPSTAAEFEDSIEIPDRSDRVVVGTVTVENEFFLPREADIQRYHACVYGPDYRPAPLIRDESRPGSSLIGGGETWSYDILIPGQAFYTENGTRLEGFQGQDTVPVETTSECPETSDGSKVLVVEGSGDRPLPPTR